MVSIQNALQIGMWVLPWAIPRGLAFYRSIRASSQGPNSSVRQPPPQVQRCLNVLYATVIISFILSFPYFAPTNIFQETNSRLLLQTNLVEHRLRALRQGNLTVLDQAVLQKLEHEPNNFRLLYVAYGPYIVTECPFCQATEPRSYLYYALPAIMTPHLFHIGLLGVITSSFFSGPEGFRWRTHATIAGVALAAAELYMTYNYDWEQNRTKRMPQEVDFFFWRMRVFRQLAFALVDALIGWVIWLTSTNRWLVVPPTIAQQMASTSETMQSTLQQLVLCGNLRNAVVRDNELRTMSLGYWSREQEVMNEVEREREVIDAKNIALSRMEVDKTKLQIDNYVEQTFARMQRPPGPTDLDGKKDI